MGYFLPDQMLLPSHHYDKEIDNRIYVLPVRFLNSAKCFDSVQISLLLKKLFTYGVEGQLQELFKFFLADRV